MDSNINRHHLITATNIRNKYHTSRYSALQSFSLLLEEVVSGAWTLAMLAGRAFFTFSDVFPYH